MSDNYNNIADKETANELLNNIFESCNISPSSKSLDTVMKKRQAERRPLFIMKMVSAIFLVLTVLTPLAFRRDPSFDIVSSSKTVAVTSHSLYDDCFVMTLSGDADYSNIYAKKNDGAIIFPDKLETSSGLVIFPYNGNELNIYIPTASGECIQAILHEAK